VFRGFRIRHASAFVCFGTTRLRDKENLCGSLRSQRLCVEGVSFCLRPNCAFALIIVSAEKWERRPIMTISLNPAIGFHCQNHRVRLKIGKQHENIPQILDANRLGCGQWLDFYINGCRIFPKYPGADPTGKADPTGGAGKT
jgi:hypothetical protein